MVERDFLQSSTVSNMERGGRSAVSAQSSDAPYVEAVTTGVSPEFEHPFRLVRERVRDIVLAETRSGQELLVTKLTGRAILALKVGMNDEQTLADMVPRIFPEDPSQIVTQERFRRILREARTALADTGQRIISNPGHTGSEATFYYEDPVPPEANSSNFVHWDAELTNMRFNSKTGYLIVAHEDGVRKGARVKGYASRALWEHFLLYPNQEVPNDDLYQVLRGVGFTGAPGAVGQYTFGLRKFLHQRLGIEYPGEILQMPQKGTRHGLKSVYRLQADLVEVMTDGRLVTITSAEQDNMAPHVTQAELSSIAFGFVQCGAFLNRLRVPALYNVWPSIEQLTALAQEGLAEKGSSVRIDTGQRVAASLAKVRTFLNDPEATDIISEWSPVDYNFKSFLQFLAHLHGARFSVAGHLRNGLELVEHVLSAQAHDTAE